MSKNDQTVRIGCGAGFSSDRLDPAVDLADRGGLDYLIFECLAERTLAFGHRDRRTAPEKGYNPFLERRLRAVLPHCQRNGTRVVTNMGVANPRGGAEKAIAVARELGLKGLKVAAVEGDDVTALIGPDTELPEFGIKVKDVGRTLIAANAYMGADAILPALEEGADVVITGRVADPSLVVAPLRHAFGWGADDWTRLGKATLVGHLLECGAQVTGGYFADPGHKDVRGLARVGFPLAEVGADGDAIITKLPDTGGLVSAQTVKEQLLYEVHDPSAYLTPDVTADFGRAEVDDRGGDRVRIAGARGAKRPDLLKVTIAFDGGLLAEAEVSYAGHGAIERAKLAAEVMEERLGQVHGLNAPRRIDLIGVSALHGTAIDYPSDARDVRLRCAMRASSQDEAELLLWEVEALLCCGPAGGGGYRGRITPSVVTYSAFLPREQVKPRFTMLVA